MNEDLFAEVKSTLITDKLNHLTVMHDTIIKHKLKITILIQNTFGNIVF